MDCVTSIHLKKDFQSQQEGTFPYTHHSILELAFRLKWISSYETLLLRINGACLVGGVLRRKATKTAYYIVMKR